MAGQARVAGLTLTRSLPGLALDLRATIVHGLAVEGLTGLGKPS